MAFSTWKRFERVVYAVARCREDEHVSRRIMSDRQLRDLPKDLHITRRLLCVLKQLSVLIFCLF